MRNNSAPDRKTRVPRRLSAVIHLTAFIGSLLLACASTSLADASAAAEKLDGTFDATTGSIEVKKTKALDVAALAEIAADPAVKSVNLDGCALKSDGVAALAASKSITVLKLEHTMVSQTKDLEQLAKLTTLEELSFGGSNFGDEGLAALCALKNLKALKLGHVGRDEKHFFTATGVKALRGLPKLETLSLHFHKPTPEMIPVLAELKTVRYLQVRGTGEDFLAALQKAMPQATVGISVRSKPAK